MLAIPPRLGQILGLLLESDLPLSVDALAEKLGVSRRTVFRDLEGINPILEKVNLTLETQPGQGIVLMGGADAEARLRAKLRSASIGMRPSNPSERRTMLALFLLNNDEIQKLYYYASALRVSESTVSGDLDRLESFFSTRRLQLDRRPSLGVSLSGSEENMRRALVDILHSPPDQAAFIRIFGYPSSAVRSGIESTISKEWLPRLDWMAEESFELLKIQLAVMVERVLAGRALNTQAAQVSRVARQLAWQLCDSLEKQFSIRLSDNERTAVATFIRAGRAKQHNPLDVDDSVAYSRMQNIAYRMIDAFDPELSHSLKLNEDLVQGLSLHLWSASVRLRQGIQLNAAMHEQLIQNFPEVYAKSRQAAKVLEQEYGTDVPDSEVAFIASHFGAALMHFGERGNHHVVLKAGIVCVAGIGVSHMMASQVRKEFRGQLEVSVSDWNSPEEWEYFDLLISSIPLESDNCPVVVVNSILTQDDYTAIRTMINKHQITRDDDLPRLSGALPQRLDRAATRFSEMGAMLRGFNRQIIHASCSFDELAKLAGYRFGNEVESGGQIYTDLIRRESISSQVIEQLKIVLLHARTLGVSQPVIGLIAPEGGHFTDPYFKQAQGCIVMLVPGRSDKDLLEIFGYVSGALVDDDVLLAAVRSGDEPVAYTRIEAAMLQYLRDYWHGNFIIGG